MKTALLYKIVVFTLISTSYSSYSQCTAEKDSEMAKYLDKTQNQDPQGCSQCGMLALYFCSARYCVKQDDVSRVGQMIQACKTNIINMGQPYCCPDYLNKEPEWGSMAGGTSASYAGGNSNSTIANQSSQNSAQLLNTLSNLNSGSSDLNTFAKNYAQGQQIAEVANGIIDLFSPSPEEKARKEQERIEAEKRAAEYLALETQRRLENEKNAKEDFKKSYLDRFTNNEENAKSNIVIYGMDYYISNKYNYDSSTMIPDWKNWMNESINKEDKFVTTIFAGKTLGYNYNKFNYNLDISKEDAIKLLEKTANSEPEYLPYFGVSYDVTTKKIKEKNAKKKVISKEVKTFVLSHVEEGSSASKIDLKAKDEILKINNSYVDDLFKTIKSHKIGDKLEIIYLKDNKEYTKTLVLGSRLKDIYNVDAMLILANYYNSKNSGNNPEKALYYFTKAAENGSPNAMFALGQIYKYTIFGDKKNNVKFKFKKNEAFALEWYLKSIVNTNFKPSEINRLYKTGSYFEPQAFDELIVMYKKGIGCEKNTSKVAEIEALKKAYVEKHSKQ